MSTNKSILGSGSAHTHMSITKSDTTTYGVKTNGATHDRPDYLWIGGAGDIVIVDAAGTSITYTVPAGTILPVRPYKVMSTNTTATGIVGLYAR